MSVAPVSARVPAGAGRQPGRLARWAVGLSAASGLLIVASVALVALLYALGGESAIEDTWVGALLMALMIGPGLGGALLAFVLAFVARVRGERRALLWLPLWAFPAVVLFVALGEALWWE